MLVIAQHTYTDNSPSHTVGGVKEAALQGADIVSFSVRLTRDNHLVLEKHARLDNDKRKPRLRSLTLRELRRHYAGSRQPIQTFEEVLKSLAGMIFLEIRFQERTAIKPLLAALKPYLKRKSDWKNFLFTSDSPFVLAQFRLFAPQAQLCLRHYRYPLTFITWQPVLRLSAVGLHRLHVSSIAAQAAHQLDIFTYVYTVNRKAALKKLEALEIDAVASDMPAQLIN